MTAKGKAPTGPRRGLIGAVVIMVFVGLAFLSTTSQKSLLTGILPATPSSSLTDAEIEELCSKHAETVPPEIRPELSEEAAHVRQVLGALGTHVAMKNATFVKLMSRFTLEERERLSWDSRTLTLYLGPEVAMMQKAEEDAVLKAAPLPDLYQLNGLNIGVGGRTIHPALLGLDAHRGIPNGSEAQLPESQQTSVSTLLAWAHDLPFKPNSIDFMVSLHNLEHLHDPAAAVLHYLDLLKPGGGLGVAIPHWQYAWDARADQNEWGHRWNTAPEVVCALHHRHWAHVATLEQLNTVPSRLSFDFVLRKKGEYVPFAQDLPTYKTGKDAYCDGTFIGPPNLSPPTIKC